MEKQKCTATSKQTGKRCGNYPAKGAKTCRFHGSANAVSKVAAKKKLEAVKAEKKLERAARTLGLSRDVSPSEALLEEVRRYAGNVQWLRERVQELEQGQLVWGKAEAKSSGDDAELVTSRAQMSVWVDLYNRERDHLVKVAGAALKAGVEERRVRLAESQGALVADVIRRILNDLGLNREQEAKVAKVVPRHLRAIAGGAG